MLKVATVLPHEPYREYKDVERVYSGSTEIDKILDKNGNVLFAVNKEVEGTPALTYKGKEETNLKNYRIYGQTVDGESVGDRTGNLFDGKFLQGYWAYADGVWVKINTWIATKKIPCKSSTTYTFSFNQASRWYGFVWFDFSGNYISANNQQNSSSIQYRSYSTISPPNAAYMAINIAGYPDHNATISPNDITDFMLVENSAPLPYEPYGYKVPVTVSNDTDTLTTPIYLPEQIKIEANKADVIDYKTQTLQKRKVIYGWHVDPTISDSFNAVTYLEDAAGMTPAAMGASTFSYGSWKNAFFMPKPCMLKSDGTVDYYLNPNDYTKKADGTPSDVANSDYDGNAMMEWSKIWYKFAGTEIDGEGYFYVSNYKVDDTYHCWCNIDSENNETDHFYTAIYNGTGTTKLRSISGVALTSTSGNGNTNVTQEVTRATANNTTSAVEWYTEVFSDKLLINALLVLMGKSLNTQATFGRGLDTGEQTAKEAYITGTLNDKGLFWGVTANGNSAVKVFGMENWWGCVWHRVAGCISVNNALKVKLTYGTADGSAANGYNQTGNGYIDNGNIPTSNNYVKTMSYNELGYSPSSVTGGSSKTFYGDHFYQNTGTRYLLLGGYSASGANAGAFYFLLDHTPGSVYWTIAAALSCKPLAGKSPTPDSIRSITLPALPVLPGTNTLSVGTEVQPSNVYLKGRIKEVS